MKNLGISIEKINDLSTSNLAQEAIQNTVKTCAEFFEFSENQVNSINDFTKSYISDIERKFCLTETTSKAAEFAQFDYSRNLIIEERERIKKLALGTTDVRNCISSLNKHAELLNDTLRLSSITDQINSFESRFQDLEPDLTGILDSINDVEIISDPSFLKTFFVDNIAVYEEALQSAQSIYSVYDNLFESNQEMINRLLGNHLSGLTVDEFIDGIENDKSVHKNSSQKVLKKSLDSFNKFELYALISYLRKRLDNPIKILFIIADVVGLFHILKFGGLFIFELIFVTSANCYLPYDTTVSMSAKGNTQRYVIGKETPVTIISDKRTDKNKVEFRNALYEVKTGYIESDRNICDKKNEI